MEEADLYCNANDVRNLYPDLNKSSLTNKEIEGFIRDVMNEVNLKLSARFAVPFMTGVNSMPGAIPVITKNFTLIKILKRKGGAEIPAWIKDEETKYDDMMAGIVNGTMFLVLSGGTVIAPSVPSGAVQADHSMEGYASTFNMLDSEYQQIDDERITDEEEAL